MKVYQLWKGNWLWNFEKSKSVNNGKHFVWCEKKKKKCWHHSTFNSRMTQKTPMFLSKAQYFCNEFVCSLPVTPAKRMQDMNVLSLWAWSHITCHRCVPPLRRITYIVKKHLHAGKCRRRQKWSSSLHCSVMTCSSQWNGSSLPRLSGSLYI